MSFNQRSKFAGFAGPQKKPIIDGSLLGELSDTAVLENKACARKVALAAQIWDSCIHQTVQVGDLITDAGNYAASETAKSLGCSKTVADTLAEIGMDLRLRLPAVRTAFEAGDIDLARVRTIYRVTGSLSLEAAQRVEAEVLHAATRLSPGPLGTEIAAIVQRTAPDEALEIRKDLKKLTGVRYRDRDMIATLEANLEPADAAACWQLITEMAATLCARDPRTRSQRLAAAYTALMHREDHLACTCEIDEDHPCTAKRELPDRRKPLTMITIDLATLASVNDLPAYLAGHGLIDAEYARELAVNSDWQVVIVEARNVADELGIPLDTNTTADEAGNAASDVAGVAHGVGTDTPDAGNATDTSDAPSTTPGRGSGSHLTFHPLGRGRRRKRGLRFPKPSAAQAPSKSNAAANEPYKGSYTLIAALEKAIAANPSVAAALHPDGHGGFVEPPASALRYRPCAELADLVRHRDRTCRFPGCDVPATSCEIDHIVPYFHHDPTHGGWTILTNLHCLCRYHHSLKTMGAWTPTMLAGAVEFWESSSGTTAVTLPGSAVGTTDLGGESLTPHIPRKRRPTCGSEPESAGDPDETETRTVTSPDSDIAPDPDAAPEPAPAPAPAPDDAVPVGAAHVDPWSESLDVSGEERVDADDPAPF